MNDSAWSPYGESRGVSGGNGPQHLLHVRQDIPSVAWLEASYAHGSNLAKTSWIFRAFGEPGLGLDHGIGHFMLFEVDSEAQAPAPLRPKSPQTSSAASDRKSALQPWFRQDG